MLEATSEKCYAWSYVRQKAMHVAAIAKKTMLRAALDKNMLRAALRKKLCLERLQLKKCWELR